MSAVVLTTLTIVCVLAVAFLKRRYRIRKLINKIPGLDGHFILGSSLEFLRHPKDKRLENFGKYFDKYGHVFRAWMAFEPVVFLADAEASEGLLTSRTNLDKTIGYSFLEPWLGTGLLTSTGKKWAERRRLLTPAFHFSILKSFRPLINEKCDILLEKLRTQENSEEFDVYPYLNNCALDVICETAMGVKVNAQDGGSEYIDAIKTIADIIIERMFSPWLWWNFTFSFTQLFKKLQQRIHIIHKFAQEVINRRRLERQKINIINVVDENAEHRYHKNKAFLDLLLDISDRDKEKFTDADVKEEVDTFMFEGHDTVSTAATWAIYQIGSHPDIQEKIFCELFSIFGVSERHPTENDINKMKYLESVLKECLRLYPAVPAIGRTLSEDTVLGEYEVPAGTIVEVNIYRLHRNPKYYSDPHKFDPERFSAEVSSKRHPFAFLPFSAGPRNCIGQKFAMLEEKLLISSLLRRYKIESLQKPEDISKVAEMVLRPNNGVKIRISRRNYVDEDLG